MLQVHIYDNWLCQRQWLWRAPPGNHEHCQWHALAATGISATMTGHHYGGPLALSVTRGRTVINKRSRQFSISAYRELSASHIDDTTQSVIAGVRGCTVSGRLRRSIDRDSSNLKNFDQQLKCDYEVGMSTYMFSCKADQLECTRVWFSIALCSTLNYNYTGNTLESV